MTSSDTQHTSSAESEKLIRNARLCSELPALVQGEGGHEFPRDVWNVVVEAILRHTSA